MDEWCCFFRAWLSDDVEKVKTCGIEFVREWFRNNYGHQHITPLGHAIPRGLVNIFSWLVQFTEYIDEVDPGSGRTALETAAHLTYDITLRRKFLESLLNAGASTEKTRRTSALEILIARDFDCEIRLMVSHGARLEKAYNLKYSPFASRGRARCKVAVMVILCGRRCGVLGRLGKDVCMLIARAVWKTRNEVPWMLITSAYQ